MGNTGESEVPPGWIASGKAPEDYVFGTDRSGARPSGFLRSCVERPRSFGTLMQQFVPGELRGKRVRFAGSVRTEDVVEHAQLWMRVDGEQRQVLSFGRSQLIRGTSPFQPCQVVLDVPPEAAALAFGLCLEGGGAAWVTGVTLEAVGPEVPLTVSFALASAPRNLGFDE